MAKKKAELEIEIAKQFVAPTILKILKPFSAKDMTKAISANTNLAKELEGDPKYLNELKMLVIGIPFADDLAKKVKRKKWITWFINNELAHKRPDLYTQIIYNPQGLRYIIKQVRKLTRSIFA